MWQKAVWKGHPMRLELTCESLIVYLGDYYATWGAPEKWVSQPLMKLCKRINDFFFRITHTSQLCISLSLFETKKNFLWLEICFTYCGRWNIFHRVRFALLLFLFFVFLGSFFFKYRKQLQVTCSSLITTLFKLSHQTIQNFTRARFVPSPGFSGDPRKEI